MYVYIVRFGCLLFIHVIACIVGYDGKFVDEVVPVSVPQRRGEPVIISEDEEFKSVRMEKIPALRPAFTKDGTVTAANASTINDGAGAMVLMSAEKASELGLTVLASIKG